MIIEISKLYTLIKNTNKDSNYKLLYLLSALIEDEPCEIYDNHDRYQFFRGIGINGDLNKLILQTKYAKENSHRVLIFNIVDENCQLRIVTPLTFLGLYDYFKKYNIKNISMEELELYLQL